MVTKVAEPEVSGQSVESKTCPKCKGTGLAGNHRICGTCRGFGFVSQRTAPCSHCHGTGFTKAHKTCDHCGGFGTLPVK